MMHSGVQLHGKFTVDALNCQLNSSIGRRMILVR